MRNEDSEPIPLDHRISMGYPDFVRLERKVDKLTDALNKLVLIEDRQANQFKLINDATTDIGKLELRFSIMEKNTDMWKNRAAGAWAVVAVLGTGLGWLVSNHLVK